MCFWELGLIYIMQQKWKKAYDIYATLVKESNWSKAVYTYLKAISLYMLANETEDETKKADYFKEVVSSMEQVTGEKRKIAGKSIPMEVSIECEYFFFLKKFNLKLFFIYRNSSHAKLENL
jgi:hypothetical protein